MDVAKGQQANEEDPEFVRQRRAAIDTLITDRLSKTQRFESQDVIRGKNLAKGFEQVSQRAPVERPNTATASVVNKPTNLAAAAAAIKANTRSINSLMKLTDCMRFLLSTGMGEESDC